MKTVRDLTLPRDEHGRPFVGASGHPMQWPEYERRGRGGPVDVRSVGGGRIAEGGSGGPVFFVVLRWPDDDVEAFRISEAFR
jgi:hypothetical protein